MRKTIVTTVALLAITLVVKANAPQSPQSAGRELERRFVQTVRPFLETYCITCHGGEKPKADLNLGAYVNVAAVMKDYPLWSLVHERLTTEEMPPDKAEKHPPALDRQAVIEWIDAFQKFEARRNAGDPGIVLARRLSNAEYNYTVRDLTGVDMRPAREFPVDPANPAGFDNSGESLSMSPSLLTKYLQASREIANHLVLHQDGFTFAPHPMLAETDRDKYCVQRIIDFYKRQNTDYADYFLAAWRRKHGRDIRSAALERRVSEKYLKIIWRALEETKEEIGPLAKLQEMWRALPAKGEPPVEAVNRLRDYVVGLRKKTELKHAEIRVKGLSDDFQPFLMWRNHTYAKNRTGYDRAALDKDPQLHVAPEQRPAVEAAVSRFSAIFPDAFYVSERGRYFPDNTRDTGRHLSAGFHNVMGYFRDDLPLYELILDEKGQRELDALWREMDFIASTTARTYIEFYLNESGEARKAAADPAATRDIISEAAIKRVADGFLARVRAANADAVATKATEDHFRWVNATIRWTEKARLDAETTHLASLQQFAARAYRRPLTNGERTGLLAYYKTLREKSELTHEEAMRDCLVSVLMSPDFCYRVDLVEGGSGIRPLTDHALASRLSYFLWASMPDAELLARAAAGDLRRPEVLAAQARRMLKDDRVRGLAAEFGGSWLDFRRFEEHNAVDRERFASFDNDLRHAMFEEPVRFILDVVRENRPVLDFLYGNHTFVNPVLARHYGMPGVEGAADAWVRIDGANRFDRGGLLPMAVFLTKNAPGLRTSPVKRGYWVVKQVLGEHIPPPPAAVPELPRDEAKLDLPLRDMLARHREDKTCASCHARFDSYGLVFEGYGPVGERRARDLAGRAVDPSATFPGGGTGSGLEGLRAHIRERRQDDFVDNLSRKLLAYALGRSLILSDEPTIEAIRTKLARDKYRFDSLIEAVVTSPQFRTKRGRDAAATH
jgi:mono/diheme cytochrome c family protein